jgi:hypothetical protein
LLVNLFSLPLRSVKQFSIEARLNLSLPIRKCFIMKNVSDKSCY